jgi:crotonobetainyl-CoA:carnitine CoA-transferase CaiB-like acyl-CoA transferase
VVPEYDGAGIIRQPSGSTVTGIVPTNTFKCADGKFVVIGGNGDSIYKRLMIAAGYPELADNPAMANNAGRVVHEKEIDAALAAWCATITAKEVIDTLEAVRVPVGPIYNVEDMMNDEHFQARGLFEEVEINGKPLKIPAMIPRLEKTPGSTRWPGPKLGSHTDEVLRDILGLDDTAMQNLSKNGII